MAKIPSSPPIAGALFLLCLATVPAEAIVDHTYVSGKGTDTGGCTTPAAACRTFAYAITQTSASGIIIAIDPADYAPLTITKSISIVADGGGPAGIIVATGTAIAISAGSAVVNLRGLTLDGEGTAGDGIVLSSAGSLTISDCFVRHFQNAGIFLNPIGALNFLVSNTISADNGNGIIISSTSAAKGVVDRFTASNNNNGIFIEAPGNVSILNSVLMNNNIVGVAAVTSGLTVIARKSVANNNGGGNGVGFNVANGATLTLADSMATGNPQAGIYISGGTVYSYGDNEINGNGTDVTGGTLTSVAKR